MTETSLTLAGRVAAISGAARGIGRATAQAFVNAGMKVAIGDLDIAAAQRTAAELGANVIAVELDVCDRDSFRRFLDETESRLGPLDVLVNNAGIMTLGPLLDESDVAARRQVDINVHGVLHGIKEGVPRMVARGHGHVVNIASTAGKGGLPGGATYCGTKHFVIGASEALRFELQGSGVEVTCVMPGIVNTELAAGMGRARGVRNAEPSDVASAIVAALREPRFDVFVPRVIGPLTKVLGILPRGTREAVARAFKADRVLTQIDAVARRDYELRAAHSRPGLESGTQAKIEERAGG